MKPIIMSDEADHYAGKLFLHVCIEENTHNWQTDNLQLAGLYVVL